MPVCSFPSSILPFIDKLQEIVSAQRVSKPISSPVRKSSALYSAGLHQFSLYNFDIARFIRTRYVFHSSPNPLINYMFVLSVHDMFTIRHQIH